MYSKKENIFIFGLYVDLHLQHASSAHCSDPILVSSCLCTAAVSEGVCVFVYGEVCPVTCEHVTETETGKGGHWPLSSCDSKDVILN